MSEHTIYLTVQHFQRSTALTSVAGFRYSLGDQRRGSGGHGWRADGWLASPRKGKLRVIGGRKAPVPPEWTMGGRPSCRRVVRRFLFEA